jgi:hypothetical protein
MTLWTVPMPPTNEPRTSVIPDDLKALYLLGVITREQLIHRYYWDNRDNPVLYSGLTALSREIFRLKNPNYHDM